MSSRLADYLKTTDVEATLVRCDTATPTVARAAATLGVSASAIVKSIVLEHRQEPRGACLAIVPGDCRVSRAKVATALAVGRLRLAPAEVVKEATGYRPGGVPPIGHRQCPAIGRGVPGRVAVSHRPAEAAYFHSSVGAEPIRGVVARIVTGPHDANRQDPHLPMRYDTGRPRAVIRLRISQPRTTSLPCPAGLRARRLSPFATHGHGRRPVRAAVCRSRY